MAGVFKKCIRRAKKPSYKLKINSGLLKKEFPVGLSAESLPGAIQGTTSPSKAWSLIFLDCLGSLCHHCC